MKILRSKRHGKIQGPLSLFDNPLPSLSPKKRVSLVIPMYNEGDAISVLLARLDAVLPTLSHYDFDRYCRR